MKRTLLIPFMVIVFLLPCSGQLNRDHNHLRAGDILIKQQVEFKDSGKPGKNITWDFSKLKTINDQYTLAYSLPPIEGDSVYILGDALYNKKDVQDNELIVGTEHNTMYYYRISGNSLLQTGHENPAVELAYLKPMVLMTYPLNYGQSMRSEYTSEGLYSGTVRIRTKGTVTTTADAYGKVILPSGDSLSPVLRVKTVQTILDDSLDIQGKALETCRWYSKGYRYPVFETVRNINLADSTEIFSTAFFYPPQDHLYLDTDPENLALLEEMWNMEQKDKHQSELQKTDAKTVKLEDIMDCRIYPNPVESIMNLEYELKENANVSFELYSMDGMPVRKTKVQRQSAGTHHQTIDCSALHSRNYVLKITANGVAVNQVIIKK
ncbi:T9SS type A sorting domain-containing protein [Prevotella sp. 10(H)]|uniref:T9SS type A sorting domain-containing protein n=1 Tax=Prevotella sp. 10(H) TaxID=1158294 RepID=UPI00068B66F6|nr:T9SS type A sorting domain-containing protein [Prevotella sp. 10(H)]